MTKPFIANLLNAVVLIALGCWGYFSSSSPSFTALIPVIGGGVLIALNNGLRRENKVISHIVVLVTLLMLFGLVKPLIGALGRDNSGALIRVSLMMLISLYALLVFVKSFVDARKRK